jgi:hypothetical protein
MVKIFWLSILFFYLSGGKAYCYSILQGDNKILSEIAEKIGENIQIEKGVKRKKPYVTLLTNVLLPASILSELEVAIISIDPEDLLWHTAVWAVPSSLTLTTLPAHIYADNSFPKVFLFIMVKIVGGLIIFSGVMKEVECAWADTLSCSASLGEYIIGNFIIFSIYISEVIDTYRAAVKYNEKLEKEKQNSQSSFFIQPIIIPKGDIFLTGGIRF